MSPHRPPGSPVHGPERRTWTQQPARFPTSSPCTALHKPDVSPNPGRPPEERRPAEAAPSAATPAATELVTGRVVVLPLNRRPVPGRKDRRRADDAATVCLRGGDGFGGQMTCSMRPSTKSVLAAG